MLSLRPGSVRALAQSSLQRAVREGLNTTRTFEALRAGGLTYRRTDFLADYRAAAGRERTVDALRSVRRDRMPSESLMATARRHQSGRYLYTVEVRVRGQEEPEYRSVSSNARLARDEVEELAVRTRRTDDTPALRGVESAELRYADIDRSRPARRST
jgi:hypothetical protein